VGTRSVLADFHTFHHLFFVTCKLLKEVAQKPPVAQPSEGGFLRQPYSSLLASPPEHAVDVTNWEKFCTLLSATLWPFISTCLREGKELISTKQCQVNLYTVSYKFNSIVHIDLLLFPPISSYIIIVSDILCPFV
jgi:senataxin